MNTQLKAKLETAIEKVFEDACEDACEKDYWNYMLHPKLFRQMTDAAEQVFDAAQDAQSYLACEMEID